MRKHSNYTVIEGRIEFCLRILISDFWPCLCYINELTRQPKSHSFFNLFGSSLDLGQPRPLFAEGSEENETRWGKMRHGEARWGTGKGYRRRGAKGKGEPQQLWDSNTSSYFMHLWKNPYMNFLKLYLII